VNRTEFCGSSKKYFMKSNAFLFVSIALFLFSCSVFSSLNSNTTIEPGKSFVLGNNEHQSFNVKLRNDSKNTIELYLAPINGGKHSAQKIASGASVKVKVGNNTALVIQNPGKDTANVTLKVTGDTGLSMGYQ